MADRNVKIVRRNGKKPVAKSLEKTASQAFDKNSLVEFASGKINPADDNDTIVLGIITEEVASTDDDYAETSRKSVEIIQPGDEVELSYTGSAPTVGASYGISNAYTVDTSDTSNKIVTVVSVNTEASTCVVVFNSVYGGNTV